MKQNVTSFLCFLILLALSWVTLAERDIEASSADSYGSQSSLKNFFSILLNREKSKKTHRSTTSSTPSSTVHSPTTAQPTAVPLTCAYLFQNYDVFPGIHSSMNTTLNRWWNKHYCNNYATCGRVKTKYGINGTSWGNTTVPHLRNWWEARNCSFPSVIKPHTTCCSVRDNYDVDPYNRSWGNLTDPVLRKWWNDNDCSTSVTIPSVSSSCGYYLNKLGLNPSAAVLCDPVVSWYYRRFDCNTTLTCFGVKVNYAVITSNHTISSWGSYLKNQEVKDWFIKKNCTSQPDETCVTLQSKYNIKKSWGLLLDRGIKNWWKMVNCSMAFEPIPWNNLNCSYIAEKYNVVPRFSWGAVSSQDLKIWWKDNCNNYYSCFGMKLKYGVVPNRTWGTLTNPYVKYLWNNMMCYDKPDESCFSLQKKHGIVPNKSWGNLMQPSVKKWWTDNDCNTAVSNPTGNIPTPPPFVYNEKSLKLAPPTPPCMRYTPTAPCSNATCGNGRRGNGLCPDGRCCNATGYCGKTTKDCQGIVRPKVFLYPPPPKCQYLFPKPFNTSLILKWAKSYKTYWCALQYIMAQPELSNVTQPDPYQFPIAAFDVLRKLSNPRLHTVAKVMYGLRPTTCVFPDNNEDLCDIWSNHVIPAPQQVVFPPVCTRTLCWFHPGSECTVYVPHWYWLETWKYDHIRRNTSLADMKDYLSNCSRVNCATRDPVNPIITKCKSINQIQDVPCPLYNCNSHGAKKRDVRGKKKKIIKLLAMIQTKSKRLHTRLSPLICGTTFSCEECQNDDSTPIDQQCYGQKWGTSDTLCCVCALEESTGDSVAWFGESFWK